MEAPGRVRGMRRRLIFVLPPNVYVAPRQGGLFGFKFSSRAHPRKFGLKRFLAVRRSWCGSRVAYFWVTSFRKKFIGSRGEAPCVASVSCRGPATRCTPFGKGPVRPAQERRREPWNAFDAGSILATAIQCLPRRR